MGLRWAALVLFVGAWGCASAPPAVHSPRPEPLVLLTPASEPTEVPATLLLHGDFRIAVISDLNSRFGSTQYGDDVHAAVDRILELRPSLVLSVGDMVAGQKRGLDYPAMWQAFHEAVSDRFAEAGIPFAIVPGNHDASAFAEFAEEREHYLNAWQERMPRVQFVDSARFPFYYAFEHEGVLLIALDATVPGPLDAEQRAWVEGVLRAAPPEQAKLVFAHLPLVAFAKKKEREVIVDPALERVLREHQVDLFVSGHHHAFYLAKVDGIRMLSVGCLGGGARPLYGFESISPRTLVMLEREGQGDFVVEGLVGRRFERMLAVDALPPWLPNPTRLVLRDGRETLPHDTALALARSALVSPRAWSATASPGLLGFAPLTEQGLADTSSPPPEGEHASPQLRVLLRALDPRLSFRPQASE